MKYHPSSPITHIFVYGRWVYFSNKKYVCFMYYTSSQIISILYTSQLYIYMSWNTLKKKILYLRKEMMVWSRLICVLLKKSSYDRIGCVGWTWTYPSICDCKKKNYLKNILNKFNLIFVHATFFNWKFDGLLFTLKVF